VEIDSAMSVVFVDVKVGWSVTQV